MRTLILAVMVCAICVTHALGAGVAVGMERSDVETALGKPSAILQRDDRLILVYPKNGRVELAKGRVVEMANVPLSDEVFEVPETTKPVTPPAGNHADESDDETSIALESKSASPGISTPPHDEYAKDDHDAEDEDSESAGLPILPLLIVAACRTVVMIVVLKLAFKWADVHADWSQMIAPALSDTVVRIAIVLIAEKALGITDLFYADEALAYLALIFVLTKTTHACTLSRALAVAAAAKLTSIVVGSLIVVMVLSLLAG